MCADPLFAWKGKDGRMVFKISDRYYPQKYEFKCGQCIQCKVDYQRKWAVRMLHEYYTTEQQGKGSCMLTLTYDDKYLPYSVKNNKLHNPTLNLVDIQNFLKRVRYYHPGIRFYQSGEYDANWRPHHHMILFGHDYLHDRCYWSQSKSNKKVYTSEDLTRCWPWGHSFIGDFTYDSAEYCAKYITKRVISASEEWLESHGVRSVEEYYDGRLPEYSTMSRRPGLGQKWIDEHPEEIYPNDKVYIKPGVGISPPRYYIERIRKMEERKFRDPLKIGTERKIDCILNRNPLEQMIERKKISRLKMRKPDDMDTRREKEKILRINLKKRNDNYDYQLEAALDRNGSNASGKNRRYRYIS